MQASIGELKTAVLVFLRSLVIELAPNVLRSSHRRRQERNRRRNSDPQGR